MEKAALISDEKRGTQTPVPEPRTSREGAMDGKTMRWIIVNILATVAIVHVNKTIFSDPALRQCQLGFVAFHFAMTWITLHVASRPAVGVFSPARTSVLALLPLTVAMGANVVLQNLALAHSSVVFFQIVRILLTPLTVLMNLFIYGARIPALAVLALVPACFGVGLVSYLEALSKPKPTPDLSSAEPSGMNPTTILGVIFGFFAVAVSALYTVWVSAYHRRLKLSSVQLLLNQLPLGALMLAVSSYFADQYPVWTELTSWHWCMIAVSGMCAVLINVSQFYIITAAGPVSSTVVGHLKTVLVIGLGWLVKHEVVGTGSALGIALAVLGIIG
ncbi:hypothetical protein A1O3_06951 [Capronia epimyces CBS 606.96]|uniref:GDP-mannose transporter n=1 Tax=Capronia epimyces CBS 606.96 TaxID=1182542 RepID=W9XJH2_9EURO|nr:uncharacterized protein A1O3_06951 [Capronia epimyces CBS 606.96]EXJ80667.1 hypothetical protein A1O3_06951 [Capronia epimyces CBS 606.96]